MILSSLEILQSARTNASFICHFLKIANKGFYLGLGDTEYFQVITHQDNIVTKIKDFYTEIFTVSGLHKVLKSD